MPKVTLIESCRSGIPTQVAQLLSPRSQCLSCSLGCRPWTSQLDSLSLGFLICTTRPLEKQWVNVHGVLRAASGTQWVLLLLR